jgi:toxin HigB-1
VRLFDQINAVTAVEMLRVLPSNRLKKLTGDLKGLWSLCINKQWRIIFRWNKGDAFDVDVVDYHT